MSSSRAPFVAVEGLDGSGKSTIANALTAALTARGQRSELLRPLAPAEGLLDAVRFVHDALDPSRTELETIKERFLSTYFTYRLALAAVKDIIPRLAAGVGVVADRYVGSHVVNQAAFGQDLGHVRAVLERLPHPDVTVFLRLPVPVALARLELRGRRGVGDTPEFLTAAAQGFERQAESHGWMAIDATQPVDSVVEAALGHLEAVAVARPVP